MKKRIMSLLVIVLTYGSTEIYTLTENQIQGSIIVSSLACGLVSATIAYGNMNDTDLNKKVSHSLATGFTTAVCVGLAQYFVYCLIKQFKTTPIIQTPENKKIEPAVKKELNACPVCYQNENEVKLITLPCNHAICKDDALDWFIKNQQKTCPLCRANVSYEFKETLEPFFINKQLACTTCTQLQSPLIKVPCCKAALCKSCFTHNFINPQKKSPNRWLNCSSCKTNQSYKEFIAYIEKKLNIP